MPPVRSQLRPPAASVPYQTVPMLDFRGGLNRTRDTPEVGANQVQSISDFDLDAGGGLKIRQGTKQATANMVAGTGVPLVGRSLANMGFYGDSQGGEKVLIGQDDANPAQIWCPSTGTVRTLTGTNAAHFYRLAGYTVIIAHEAASHNAIRIDDGNILAGSITTMSTAYEDSYESPSTQGHPPARYGCTQHYRAWVVDESQVNRVRFSHPNDPRYWHTDDWIDVGPSASDIVGLYPLGDVVLCVKQDSVWYFQGDVLAAMRLRRLDELVAAGFSDAFNTRTNVMALGLVWIWTKGDGLVSISPNIQVSKHAEQLRRFGEMPDVTAISAADSKIFCHTDDETYVFDTATGGWTVYSYPMAEVTNVTLGTYANPGDEVTVFLDQYPWIGENYQADPSTTNQFILNGDVGWWRRINNVNITVNLASASSGYPVNGRTLIQLTAGTGSVLVTGSGVTLNGGTSSVSLDVNVPYVLTYLGDDDWTVTRDMRTVMVFDETIATDRRGVRLTGEDITASVRTPWIVGQGPTEPDKWGRPRFLVETVDDTVDLSGSISLYKNLEDDPVVSTLAWTLDESEEGRTKNVRGPSGGRGESVSYSITMTGGRGYLHAIVPRFRPQRIKR